VKNDTRWTADAGAYNRPHSPALLTLELVDGAQDVTEGTACLEVQETLRLRERRRLEL